MSQWSTTDNWIARGLALLVVTFTCGIHAGWRLGGIYLNNAFAIVKISMLLFIFITGCLTWGGVFHRSPEAISNLNSNVAFENPSKDAYAFAEAYLAVVFAFGGFNQANYVSVTGFVQEFAADLLRSWEKLMTQNASINGLLSLLLEASAPSISSSTSHM